MKRKVKIVYREVGGGERVGDGVIITIAVVANIVLHAALHWESYLFERSIERMKEGKE